MLIWKLWRDKKRKSTFQKFDLPDFDQNWRNDSFWNTKHIDGQDFKFMDFSLVLGS